MHKIYDGNLGVRDSDGEGGADVQSTGSMTRVAGCLDPL